MDEIGTWLYVSASNPFAVLISRGDYDWVSELSLFRNNKNGYVYASISRRMVAVHKLIFPKPFVDHKNQDKLDNRRSNLRESNKSLNAANSRKRKVLHPAKKGTPIYKGVTWNTGCDTFTARCCRAYLGSFKSALEAAQAYDKAALEAFGDHAQLNFPKAS